MPTAVLVVGTAAAAARSYVFSDVACPSKRRLNSCPPENDGSTSSTVLLDIVPG